MEMQIMVPPPIAAATKQLLEPYKSKAAIEKFITGSEDNEQPDTAPRLLTINEAARRLRVTRQCIYNWHNEGRLELVKIGKRRRMVPISDVEKLENGGEVC